MIKKQKKIKKEIQQPLDENTARENELWLKEQEARKKMLYAFKRAVRLIDKRRHKND